MLKLETDVKCVQYLCAVFKLHLKTEFLVFGKVATLSYPVTNPIDALQNFSFIVFDSNDQQQQNPNNSWSFTVFIPRSSLVSYHRRVVEKEPMLLFNKRAVSF